MYWYFILRASITSITLLSVFNGPWDRITSIKRSGPSYCRPLGTGYAYEPISVDYEKRWNVKGSDWLLTFDYFDIRLNNYYFNEKFKVESLTVRLKLWIYNIIT